MARARRPVFSAAIRIVPLPQKGSRTRLPRFEQSDRVDVDRDPVVVDRAAVDRERLQAETTAVVERVDWRRGRGVGRRSGTEGRGDDQEGRDETDPEVAGVHGRAFCPRGRPRRVSDP